MTSDRALVTIRGQWISVTREKPTGPVFRVASIEGKKFETEVEFMVMQPVGGPNNHVAPIVGHQWELRGVEKGEFVGFSSEVWDEFYQGRQASPVEGGFKTKFCYVRARQLGIEVKKQ